MVERVERRATYTTLSAIFLAIFGAFTLRLRREREDLQLQPLDLVQLGFATYRLGRLTAYDKVAETYRAPFTETIQDQTGAGKTVVPEGMAYSEPLASLSPALSAPAPGSPQPSCTDSILRPAQPAPSWRS